MTQPEWIDIGVNLTDKSFAHDRDQVIETAFAAGVSQMILTGTTLAETEQAIQLCLAYPGQLFCTAGVHPHYSQEHSAAELHQIKGLLTENCVVAVGETGLDFNRNFSPAEDQVRAFESQLEMACELSLPLFLHERDAHKKQLEMLRSHRDDFPRAVAHCFTGSREELYNYLDLDLYIGITGWVCDERRGKELQAIVKEIPANRLMLETDAPYLLPRTIRPKPKSRRNLPEYLIHVAELVAELCNKPLEQLSEETVGNSQRFFCFESGLIG